MKLIYKILIIIGIALALYTGGFIHGRYSIQKKPSKYVNGIRTELDNSIDANRQLRENNKRYEELNQRIGTEVDECLQLVDGTRSSTEDLSESFTITRRFIEASIDLLRTIREEYSEIVEEE